MARTSSVPLVRCRDCASPLLQPVASVAPLAGLSIVVRRCPDCGRRDSVVADGVAVQVWLARERRIADSMAAAADDLAARIAFTDGAFRP
jgi:hypothetical protein